MSPLRPGHLAHRSGPHRQPDRSPCPKADGQASVPGAMPPVITGPTAIRQRQRGATLPEPGAGRQSPRSRPDLPMRRRGGMDPPSAARFSIGHTAHPRATAASRAQASRLRVMAPADPRSAETSRLDAGGAIGPSRVSPARSAGPRGSGQALPSAASWATRRRNAESSRGGPGPHHPCFAGVGHPRSAEPRESGRAPAIYVPCPPALLKPGRPKPPTAHRPSRPPPPGAAGPRRKRDLAASWRWQDGKSCAHIGA